MIYRSRSKPFIAFFMSMLVLLSSVGIPFVPIERAKASASSGPSSIIEWLPAPGQFVNEASWGGTGDINAMWTNSPGSPGISLGAFGGSIVFAFDEPIPNDPKHPFGVDFTVFGNAFSGNEEPASVEVAEDDGSGNPGPWYRIAGSEHYEDATIWDYRVTYTNPEPEFTSANGVDVPWEDNRGGSGQVKTNASHQHAYYPIPANYPLAPADFNNESYTYSGVNLSVRKTAFGYPDSHANGSAPFDTGSNPYGAASTKGDPIDISWAVDDEGKPVYLSSIRFVKITNAVQIDGGAMGEVGAEITSLQRVVPVDTVQETADLSSIVLTGVGADASVTKEVYVTSDVYVYDDIVIDADAIKVTANGTASNIYVNNMRGTAGTQVDKEIALSETTPRTVRVIAQEGNNTPKIYYLQVKKKASVPQTQQVAVAVSGFSAAAGKSVSLAARFEIEAGQTAAYAIEKALNDNSIPFENEGGNYITSVGGLAAFDGGPKSGWMYLVNGQFAMVGIADYVLESNDVVTLIYTDDYEQDITTVADKTALNAKIAEIEALAQNDYTAESWHALQDDLMLAKSVAANGAAIQYHADTALAGLIAARQALVAKVPVQTIAVTFSVSGYSANADKNVFLPPATFAMEVGKTAADAIDKALTEAGIPYENAGGNYISSVGGLAEFDGGPMSGWLFTVDGAYPDVGIAGYVLTKDVSIVLRYTDNYMQEFPQTQEVTVAVGGFSAAAGKSVSLAARFEIEAGQTAAYAIEKALNANNIPFVNEGGNYITSVGGLAAFDGGPKSGWMYLINGQFAMVGIADYVLESNDVVTLIYTDDYEQDITTVADKTALSAKIAEIEALTQDDYTAESWHALQDDLMLAKSVAANGAAIQYHADTALAGLIAARQALVAKPPVQTIDLEEAIEGAAAYFLPLTEDIGEWGAIGLARSGQKLPESYYRKLVDDVVENQATFRKVTDLERTILAIAVSGGDATNVAGYDLIKKLSNHDRMTVQGINGLVFALIALDSKGYEVDAAAKWTRPALIEGILSKQNADGGFALSTGNSDPDVTAMTLTALAPYAGNAAVSNADAIGRAAEWLSANQKPNGGYGSAGAESSESVSQAIIALTANGIDPTSAPYTKNGVDLLEKLLRFRLADGSFSHTMGAASDVMATEQALQALVAYKLFKEGNGERLYDFTKPQPGPEPEAPTELPLPSGDQPKIVIPNDAKHYIIPVTTADADKEITVDIPSGHSSKVRVSLPVGSSLPKIEAVKGNVSMVIPKGATITDGDASALELITSNDPTDSGLRNKLDGIVGDGKKLDAVYYAITIGGAGKVQFDRFVTLTLTGMGGKEAAYIQNEAAHAISKFAGDAEGRASGKDEYAYDSGSDLIVKTTHFTDFVAFATSDAVSPGGGGQTPTAQITLSVDKLTIGKGNVISPVSITLETGDTAWSVLKRALDARGISYEYEWSAKYGSVYVRTIDGDGEFDHGPGSGWMVNVNGVYLGYGADKHALTSGDTVRWRYTTNLGADLGQAVPSTPNAGGGGAAAPAKGTAIEVPANLSEDFVVDLEKGMRDGDTITINIPNVTSKVILNLSAVKERLPAITAAKGDVTFTIDKDTALTSGTPRIEVLTAVDPNDRKLQGLVQLAVPGRDTKVHRAFAMGNPDGTVLFDKALTFVVKGAKEQLAGFLEGNTFTPIDSYASEAEGAAATQGDEKYAYAYAKDRDLVIRTNHFTTFVTYSVSDPETEQPMDLLALYSDAGSISPWAVDGIAEATKKRILNGHDGRFLPKNSVTRAEFAKMLAGALELDISASAGSNFADVASSDWYSPYVDAAYEAGIVEGYDGRFRPNETVTREQMAAILSRALRLPTAGSAAAIKDLDRVAEWAREDVLAVTSAGLISGWDERFHPADTVTREMAAVVTMRAFHYQGETAGAPGTSEQLPDAPFQAAIREQIEATAAYMQQMVSDPTLGSIGGDWTVVALARSDASVPDAYYAKYISNVEDTVAQKFGKLHAVKLTEYDRVILGLSSLGRDVDRVAGYNLLEPLADYDTLVKQGINGPIFALIALDSKSFAIPAAQAGMTQTTRERLIEFILNREMSGGGWALGEQATEADADVTAMAVQGLTPYVDTNTEVKAAVNRAVAWLSKAQNADGGYASGEAANVESIAQVVIALSGLGIDAHADARFVKNGRSAIDALSSFADPSGGFYHVKPGGTDNGGAKPGEVDPMATDQAMLALVAYERFLQEKPRLYDMNDSN